MQKRSSVGFSLVELLIAIVVLAILAAITTVAYNGIQKRAQTASLQHDMRAMDAAQKRYMAQTSASPLSYNSSGEPNDTLAFVASKGNSILVHLRGDDQYCVYGYNPGSHHPNPEQALMRSSDGIPCATLTTGETSDPDGTLSTVAIIGQRLEAYRQQYGYYPGVDSLVDIGLVIKPNSDGANQQQLYCRNAIDAIYLQVDKLNDLIYVYVTASHSVTQPVIDTKLSLANVCGMYNINNSDAGYESTGLKNPDL